MGARAEARARIVTEVLRLGRAQLAEVGAAALSLRAIARELGVVSSAVYRYFPSRDALLTALIIESFNELGASCERAERAVPREQTTRRFLVTAQTVRKWALSNPNEWALIFGSPVPGYSAPEDTIGPASRVPVLLVGILRDLPAGHAGAIDLGATAAQAIAPLRDGMAPDLNANLVAIGYTAWMHVVGAVSTEVFGHQTNVIDAAKRARIAFFDAQMHAMADLLRLD